LHANRAQVQRDSRAGDSIDRAARSEWSSLSRGPLGYWEGNLNESTY
jgi:hypothetical protein